MITIDRIEKAVVERIKTALPKAHVEAYPADVRQFVENFRHVRGAILVQYTGRKRKYLAPQRGSQVVSIEISAIGKHLRDEHAAIYTLLDASFLAVSGVPLTEKYQTGDPSNPIATRGIGVTLYQQEESFETYLEKYGLWIYTQQYESDPFPFLVAEEESEVLIQRMELIMNEQTELVIPEEE